MDFVFDGGFRVILWRDFDKNNFVYFVGCMNGYFGFSEIKGVFLSLI